MYVNRSGLVVPVAVAIETLAGDDLFFQSYSKAFSQFQLQSSIKEYTANNISQIRLVKTRHDT